MYTLFLCGDVMTGRAIDQILPYPSNPVLYERYIKDSNRYVRLAEKMNGRVHKPVSFDYIWGEALEILDQVQPHARIINLETSVTANPKHWVGKSVHYRTHPENAPCLKAAEIDCCVLANNHVLDWEYEGLQETLWVLEKQNIKTAGAGEDLQRASAPAIMDTGMGRIIVISIGFEDSGIPKSWAASRNKPGVNLFDFSQKSVRIIKEQVKAIKRPGDIVVISVHWGSNWGYEVPAEHRWFARELIDHAGVDLIHGHSSHHVKGIEIYKDKLILFGCGDFITDYEGIPGFSEFRDDLGLMYFPILEQSGGCLKELMMFPTRLKNFRINRATKGEAEMLKEILNEYSNVRFTYNGLAITWKQ